MRVSVPVGETWPKSVLAWLPIVSWSFCRRDDDHSGIAPVSVATMLAKTAELERLGWIEV